MLSQDDLSDKWGFEQFEDTTIAQVQIPLLTTFINYLQANG
jgi:hypothetical protein